MNKNSTDLDSHPISFSLTKDQSIRRFFARIITIGLVCYIALVINVFPAEAGVLSFVSDLFSGGAEAISQKPLVNSQNMPLLQATLASAPNASRGGGEITIVGGTSLLPETGPSGTIADIEDHLPSTQISIYVVHEGDTLSGIAKMFGVSVNTIVWANDIKRGIISVGQTIVILPISGIQHTVKSGDTLKSIAKKYKADADEILQYNDLSEKTVLAVGEVVIIPDGEIEVVAPSVSKPSKNIVRGVSGPNLEGYYLRPISGGKKSQGLHGYNGVDLAAPIGTPIYSSAPGTVLISKSYGWNGGYGQYVVIQHDNGTQTLYSHLSANFIDVGNWVTRGQLIGAVGSTGKSTGAHIHFEVRGARNPF